MHAPAFDDLLDEHLAIAPPPSARLRMSGLAGTATSYGFFFGASSAGVARAVGTRDLSRRSRGTAEAGQSHVERSSPPRGSAPGATVVASPIIEPILRLLSTAERAALAEMNALGAKLSPSFTFGELRRAFRSLALRYHPDRHTSRSVDERAQLSERFTRARGAYQILAGGSRRV